LRHHKADQRQVREPDPRDAHPSPAAPAPGHEQQLAQHGKGDDGDVQHQNQVSKQGGGERLMGDGEKSVKRAYS
jgi:hypothetical protein